MKDRWRAAAILALAAQASLGCHFPPLTAIDHNVQFGAASPDAIVVFGFSARLSVWLTPGIDDGVNWACGGGRVGEVWRVAPERGFVVARLPARTGKQKYAIRKLGNDIEEFAPAANQPVWVFNAEPGKVMYVGSLRVEWSNGRPALLEDASVSATDADEFVTRTFPNIRDHVVERRMDWIYLGMNCR